MILGNSLRNRRLLKPIRRIFGDARKSSCALSSWAWQLGAAGREKLREAQAGTGNVGGCR